MASELESDLRDTVDWGRKWLYFSSGKTQLVSLDHPDNTGAIDVKMNGSVLEEKSSFKVLGLTFSSELDWGSYITVSLLLKLLQRKLEIWFVLWSFFLQRLLCISINLPWSCMEYFCYVWAGGPSCNLELLDKLQKSICRTVGCSLAASLEPLAHHWNVASLSFL